MTTSSSTSPLEFWWMHQNPVAQIAGEEYVEWLPFTIPDNQALEAAYQASQTEQPVNNNSKDPNLVLVNGGRYVVDIKNKTVSCLYWREKVRKVLRGSWFVASSPSLTSPMIPYSESEAALIEEFFFPSNLTTDELQFSMAIPPSGLASNLTIRRFPLSDRIHYIADRNELVYSEAMVITKEIPLEFWQFTLERTIPRIVKRGLPYQHRRFPEYDESGPVKHLVLVVHGIGEHLWSQGINLGAVKVTSHIEHVNHIRTIGYELSCLSTNSITRFENEASSPTTTRNSPAPQKLEEGSSIGSTNSSRERVEFLPVHWYDSVHTREFQERISRIALKSIGPVRIFSNQVLIDSLIYLSPEGQQQIQDIVIKGLNATFQKFTENCPSFSGKVSLIGHSLGSVITFDILRTRPESLSFRPENLYTIGSPIGLFYTATGSFRHLTVESELKTCPNVWNIFHAHDPVAYRIESLIDPAFANIDPVVIDSRHPGIAANISAKIQRIADYFSGFWTRRSLTDFSTSLLTSVSTTSSSPPSTSVVPAASSASPTVSAPEEPQPSAGSSFFFNLVSFAPFPFPFPTRTISTPVINHPTTNRPQETLTTPNRENIEAKAEPEHLCRHIRLNRGKRIDYCLKETIFDRANNYLSSLTCHVSYFSNVDAVGFIFDSLQESKGENESHSKT